MRNSNFIWGLLLIIIIIEIYVFQALKTVTHNWSGKIRFILFSAYWIISIFSLLFLVLMPYLHTENWPRPLRSYTFAILIALYFSKLLASVFFLIDDLRRIISWSISKFSSHHETTVATATGDDAISRSVFLSWLGLAAGGTLFSTFVYGFSNKYKYQVKRFQLAYSNLPASFKGLKIIHISDIHSGSFNNKQAVEKGVEKILNEKPDLILFTGDLVNDRATEMKDYMDVFSKLKAPMGVYSTLGNHDYGDYISWHSVKAKQQNLEQLKSVHAQLGWRLLMNEHVPLEKGGEQIALLGIENWSAKSRFPKHGKMNEAHAGTEKYPFKILMSHDPSHWDAEVIPKYGDVDLTLSGHTHGMQFGVELPGFKWSPVQYMYKQWAGLYENGKQKLYVNRGYGFIGYPGRVGILPEITVVELV